jgi:hypothetical protein
MRSQLALTSAKTGERLFPFTSSPLDSSGEEREEGAVPSELERITAIEDPFVLLRTATERLSTAQQEVTELSRLRRRVIQDLHAKGLSYAQIAAEAGLSRGRIHQIRHTGPAPEGAFLGTGTITVATPLKREAANARPVVAMEDVTAAKRLEDLARSFELEVDFEHIPLGGQIDLDRPGLVVICGPRLSDAMAKLYAQDPVLRWEQAEDGPWTIRDTRTGTVHRSGMDSSPSRPSDVAYLGRLPRPDGHGTVIALTGVHPQGTLGVIHLLTTEIATLWGQTGDRRFSAVVGTTFDPDTHEPTEVELLSPLYSHEEG